MYPKKNLAVAAVLLTGLGSCQNVNGKSPETPLAGTGDASRPNVLLIIMDDMCDWARYLGGNDQVRTPNLDRLAQRGVWFKNAYCAVPLSNPSRTALFTGLHPTVTGIYTNDHQLQHSEAVENCVMLPEHFKSNGYTTLWSGKVFHNKPSNAAIARGWDDWEYHDGGYGPWSKNSIVPPELPGDKWRKFEAWAGPETDFPDVINSNKVIGFLRGAHEKPFFIAMGLYRPHTPYTAPKRFFDQYDLATIQRPEILENDLGDIPGFAVDNFVKPTRDATRIWSETANWQEQFIRAYLASISFADDRVGAVLDALDASPYGKNTIVILVGDNGFHQGQKERTGKSALWREACHVPMIVSWPASPDVANGKESLPPVSLVDIYPTLIGLCGLPRMNGLAGNDLSPLLKNPSAAWDKPCMSTFRPGNFVVHKGDWNYIRYRDNSEELYNIAEDENEWYNLAGNAKYKSVIGELSAYMPKTWVQPVTDGKPLDDFPNRALFAR